MNDLVTADLRTHTDQGLDDAVEWLQLACIEKQKLIKSLQASLKVAEAKIEQRDKVCALRLHTQDDEGIWYSMTDCGLSGTIGYEESSLDDGRSFCPSCGGKVVIQSLENSDE